MKDQKKNSYKKDAPKKKWFPKKREQKVTERTEKDKNDGVRLNKYLANAGICSRREADVIIPSGVVEINGKPATALGTKVMPTDEVKYDGQILRREKPVYILMNKPKGFVTIIKENQNRRTVLELIKRKGTERLVPAIPLEKDTTGVLLLTNDADLLKTLASPKANIKRLYHIHIDKPAKQGDLDKLTTGITLEDGVTKADVASFVGKALKKNEIGLEINSNKYKVIHRMLEKIGFKVMKLDLVSYAGLTKKRVPRSENRTLTPEEIMYLKRIK